MAQPHIGEIRIFAGNFAPVGWAFCEGQLLPISENDTLFTLIGTTYGGDGQSTFALPDLRGRVPMHMGNGFILAETGGVESVTLTVSQIPVHNHMIAGNIAMPAKGDNPGTRNSPVSNAPAIVPGKDYYSPVASGSRMAPLVVKNQSGVPSDFTLQPSGGSQPHENMQPYLAVNYIISLFGIFPTQ